MLAKAQRTSQGDYPAIEIVVVEVTSSDGIVGYGEGLARRGAAAYAQLIDAVLAPRLIGKDPADRRALWKTMRAALSGRPGGQLVEAISAVDIALWDIAGKAANQPIHKLLGGMGRTRVPAYASSINWLDDAAVETELRLRSTGFREIKVKLGHPLKDAIARARFVRKLAGDDIALYVDANWAYDVDDALIVGRALADLGYGFSRSRSRRMTAPAIAASPSICRSGWPPARRLCRLEALAMLQDRSLGLIQPDVARSGGITETWRIAELAASFNTAYAPHVGWSGAICVAASLQLAAAAETLRTFECMVANPLRDSFTHPVVGEGSQLVDGQLMVHQGAGLGIEIDRDMLARHRIA